MRPSCIDTPISWLALELHALGEAPNGDRIATHLRKCKACNGAFDSIQSDRRVMPALQASVAQPRQQWRPAWGLGAFSLAAVAALLLWLGVAKQGPGTTELPAQRTKGEIFELQLIRESNRQIVQATHFAPSDRFKLRVSCTPGPSSFRVSVEQDGEITEALPPGELECGNGVVLPGAFHLEGGRARICLHLRRGESSEQRCLAIDPM